MPDPRPPKVFLSYSWTSDDYAERIRRLAVRFMSEAHVDVVFDRWDLAPGQDLGTFMERSVGDSSIDYVLILCDPRYAERADAREGGVGTETLVISQEVFADARQTKFIPVIMERDEVGNPAVPIYMRGRFHFDLSNPATEIAEFQRLVEYLHGVDRGRPALGPRPAYLDVRTQDLLTGRRAHVFRDAVTGDRSHQILYLREYLESLSRIVAELTTLPEDVPDPLDEWTVTSIELLRPYRNEFAETVQFIGKYDPAAQFSRVLHAFFERLLAERVRRRARAYSEEHENTAISFVSWEMFLYALAALLREERFEHVRELFVSYHAPARMDGLDTGIRSFTNLDTGFRLLDEVRNSRLSMRRISLAASMVNDAATVDGISFESLIEADVVCWLRSALSPSTDWFSRIWWPRLLVDSHVSTLPLFARAARESTFTGLARALNVRDRADLVERWGKVVDAELPDVPYFWGGRKRYETLIQLEHLGSRL